MSDAAPTIADVEAVEAAAHPSAASRRRLAVDLVTSYALAGARVASMAAVIAILFRYCGPKLTGVFVLARTMVGLLNYAFAGLSPATQHAIAERQAAELRQNVAQPVDEVRGPVLAYPARLALATSAPDPTSIVYGSALAVALAAAFVAMFAVGGYAANFATIHRLDYGMPAEVGDFAFVFGMGTLVRLLLEPASAALQSRGWLSVDNVIVAAGELYWPWLVWSYARDVHPGFAVFMEAGMYFGWSCVLIACARAIAARIAIGAPRTMGESLEIDLPSALAIARRAAAVSAGSFADFLYAPFNLFLINAALGPVAVADYTPALQFDAALLLLVSSIAAVVLPRAMRLVGEGRQDVLRTLYVRSTLTSLGILAAAAITLVIASPLVLRVWLGQPMPVTRAILPLVLIHTVIGGTAGIGRAVLLGMGRFRAYTLSAIVGGVANVLLALLFVLGFGWGLRGIVLATIVAVVGRCAIWMPWYVLRAFGKPTPVGSDPVRA